MERVSQVILRNADRLRKEQTLLINPARDSLFQKLSENERKVSVFTQDFGDYTWLDGNGAKAEFGLLPVPSSASQDIVLVLPRERDRLQMILHLLASCMPRDSVLWLAGENRSGIKSSGGRLADFFRDVRKVDNARHCSLFRASGPVCPEQFELEHYQKPWTVLFKGKDIPLISLPGVFAHGKLDKGSELLLKAVSELKPKGNVLDFACGSGVIGVCLLADEPSVSLSLLDVSATALEATRQSLKANELEARVFASDGLENVDGAFDWIISNPPFHRGIASDLGIARKFFEDARKFLSKTGKMLLVCNRHLPYRSWLMEHFNKVEVVQSNNAFRVILAARPLRR